MGMMAVYYHISDEQLEIIHSLEEDGDNEPNLMELLEEWEENANPLLNIDKLWDVMHMVFTGRTSSRPIEDHPLSEAIVGQYVLDTEDFVAYTLGSRVAAIVAALDAFDMEGALQQLSGAQLKKARLYPSLEWNHPELMEDVKKELNAVFTEMKAFYREMLSVNGHILVSIL